MYGDGLKFVIRLYFNFYNFTFYFLFRLYF